MKFNAFVVDPVDFFDGDVSTTIHLTDTPEYAPDSWVCIGEVEIDIDACRPKVLGAALAALQASRDEFNMMAIIRDRRIEERMEALQEMIANNPGSREQA